MPAPRSLTAQATALQDALLAWYQRTRRTLPWRETPSLYGTVVSEFMLQQTQVKTVLPYYARWLGELPDFASLAAAPESKVLHLWEGLGYYSRARNLHKLARHLNALPSIPRDQAAWMEMPGIGPYTSAAITSIAFGTPAACVDGNVVRILARLSADATAYRDSASASKAMATLAGKLLNTRAPGDHNQAMMELGATLCTRQNPQCLLCPVAAFCEARRLGTPEAFPVLAAKTITKLERHLVWSVNEEGLLLFKADASSKRLALLHELPTGEQAGVEQKALEALPVLASQTRGITRYRITERLHGLANVPAGAPGLVRVPLAKLSQVTLSGPHRRWIGVLLQANALQ